MPQLGTRRDRAAERSFLSSLPPAFADRVIQRLDRAGEQLGHDGIPDDRTVLGLVEEIREECEDIAGWAAMTLQVAAGRMPTARLVDLRRDLTTAADLASAVDQLLAEAAVA